MKQQHTSGLIIAGPRDDDDKVLYWSNLEGWVNKENATVFTDKPEYLPAEATGVETI